MTTTETAKVTKLPAGKAKGVKTTAKVRNPSRKPGTAKGRKTTTNQTRLGRLADEWSKRDKKTSKPAREAKNGKAKRFGWALPDFANDNVIIVLVKKNPYPKGSKAAERFKLFQTGQIVAECLAAQKAKGYRRRRIAIRNARESGYIKIG